MNKGVPFFTFEFREGDVSHPMVAYLENLSNVALLAMLQRKTMSMTFPSQVIELNDLYIE